MMVLAKTSVLESGGVRRRFQKCRPVDGSIRLLPPGEERGPSE